MIVLRLPCSPRGRYSAAKPLLTDGSKEWLHKGVCYLLHVSASASLRSLLR